MWSLSVVSDIEATVITMMKFKHEMPKHLCCDKRNRATSLFEAGFKFFAL